jgi:hypothetical protein
VRNRRRPVPSTGACGSGAPSTRSTIGRRVRAGRCPWGRRRRWGGRVHACCLAMAADDRGLPACAYTPTALLGRRPAGASMPVPARLWPCRGDGRLGPAHLLRPAASGYSPPAAGCARSAHVGAPGGSFGGGGPTTVLAPQDLVVGAVVARAENHRRRWPAVDSGNATVLPWVGGLGLVAAVLSSRDGIDRRQPMFGNGSNEARAGGSGLGVSLALLGR